MGVMPASAVVQPPAVGAHHRGLRRQVRQQQDPGGHAGLGFRRLPDPPHTLEIDPDRMPIAVGLFERYALGNVSATQLEAETGLAASRSG